MELKTQCRERFKPAVDAINEIIKQEDNTDRPILVAIDGRCGSGKTTLGEYLKGQFDCNLFHMDDFFTNGAAYTGQNERNRWECRL